MEQDLKERLKALEAKVDEIHEATRKTQQYLKITAWVTVIVLALPLLGLMIAIPAMLSGLDNAMNILQY